ncbi:MAG: HD domain-containing protein [Deltaproteobacteria bacterium]|nr:HD domain-containing protein [Deltaproteobacteria bacterium]
MNPSVHSESQQDQLSNLSRLLLATAANASLYSPDHQLVLRLRKSVFEELQQLFEQHGEITLKIVGDQLIFAENPVVKSSSTERLIATLEKIGVSYLKIGAGVRADELQELILFLGKDQSKKNNIKDSENIHYGKIEVRSDSSRTLSLSDIAAREPECFMDLYQQARNHQKMEASGVQELVDGLVAAFNDQSDVFLALAPLRAMDEYTYTHSTNVCILNLAQAKALGIEGQLLNDIGVAAMLHDVGKMFIPPEILAKPGKPTEEEWWILQQHPHLGAKYLLDTPGVPRLAVVTAYEHHMQYNNGGYPETVHPRQLHTCSHMTAISDTYDAMRTRRSYEESLDQEKIIGIMQKLAGNKLHPQLTHNFLQLISRLEKND